MKNAWLAVLLVVACGGNERADDQDQPENDESPSSMGTSRGENRAEPNAEEDEPRPNRSAGPARAGFEVVPQRMHRQSVNHIAVFGRHAAAGSYRGMVTIFDVPSGHVRAARRLFFGPVAHLEVSADRKRLFALGSNAGEDDSPSDAVVWDLETDRVWRVPNYTYGTRYAVSPNGEYVACLEETPAEISLHLHTVWGGSRTRNLEIGSPRQVIFARDSRSIYAVYNQQVHPLRLPAMRPVGEPWSVPDGFIAPHPTEDLVAVAAVTGLEIRALADGEVKHAFDADRVSRAEWSADGSRVMACSRNDARVFGGEDYATTVDLPRGRSQCYELAFDLRAEAPAIISANGDQVQYTAAGEGSEPLRLEPRLNDFNEPAVGLPPTGDWFLYGSETDVYIANLTRRRARRLVRGGAGELSAWSVDAGEDASITLRGRGWAETFGASETEDGTEATETAALEFPEVEGESSWVEPLATSKNGRHRIVVEDPTDEANLFLLSADAPRAIPLRQPPRGLGIECDLAYDEEYGEEDYYCDALVAFAPDASSFVVGGSNGTASYDLTGRRLGAAPAAMRVHFTPDGSSILAIFNDGAISMLGTNLRRTGVVLRARDRMLAQTGFDDAGTMLAAVRGAALVIYDLEANTRKHLVTLPARSNTTPTFTDDGMVQVQLENAFVWYGVEDGTEARRVDLDDIRGIDETREHAVYCKDDRLRHRALSDEGEGMDLGPCPHDARELAFNQERVWWVEGTRGHVVRLSDAEHLIVGAYQSRRPLLYAFTPRGHFWINRPDAVRALRVRNPGPVLDAEASVPEADSIRETLIADYLADRDLGDP